MFPSLLFSDATIVKYSARLSATQIIIYALGLQKILHLCDIFLPMFSYECSSDVIPSSRFNTVITHLFLKICFKMCNAEICLEMTLYINHSRMCLVLATHNEI